MIAALLVVMRRLERWLHQHIFKVGWLLTRNLETTTILYYLIFLPGVFAYEFVLWLVAGIFNVRAERAIAWPEAQAVAELRLNFIRLSKTAGSLKTAIISISPLISGVLIIGYIANNVLDVSGFVQAMGDGNLENLGAALAILTSTPDFWLWVYLIFVIGNTMWPDFKALRGWKPIVTAVVVVVVLLYMVGLGEALISRTLMVPILQGINILSGALGVLIVTNLFFTAVLGAVESLIERITGDSATFQNGKLVAMRRAEVLQMRQQQREREAKQAAAAKTQRAVGLPSIYSFPLPIPGGPGKEPEPIIVRKEEAPALPTANTGRAGPAMITGTATVISESTVEEPPGSPAPPRQNPAKDAQKSDAQEEADERF